MAWQGLMRGLLTCSVMAILSVGCSMSGDRSNAGLDQVEPIYGLVTSDGLRIHYRRSGAGPPLMLVHGWGSDLHRNWVATEWIHRLDPVRTVIAIDVRGHGKSDKPHALEPYSYAAMSADVLAVMDDLQIEQADFMGYSMGAFMGAHLLGHQSSQFNGFVLGGIGNETQQSAAQGDIIAQALRASELQAINSTYGKAVRRYVELNPQNDLQALAYSAQQMWPDGYPLRIAGSNISQSQNPVLIVNGADDHPYVDSVAEFAGAVPNNCYVEIPHTDHMSVIPDARFKSTVVDFLTRL